jgi:hypothetical protein
MKFVNQTDGHDLDANNGTKDISPLLSLFLTVSSPVDLMLSQKKTRPTSYDRKPIEFGHALPTTCAKCGSAGKRKEEETREEREKEERKKRRETGGKVEDGRGQEA